MGTSDGEDIIAVNPDGTERWRKTIGTRESAPAIGEDGTVYIGTMGINDGYLHAIGPLGSNAPTAPEITGMTNGNTGAPYEYTFKSTSPLGNDVYYYITWGDGAVEEWVGPYTSGQTVTLSHTWSKQGTFTIKARAKDTDNLWGPWGELTVTMPRNKLLPNTLFMRLLERFPNLFPILQQLLLRLGLQ